MRHLSGAWLVAAVFSVAACSTEGMYQYFSDARLADEAFLCQNGDCMYEIGLTYLQRGQTDMGWYYIDLSARDGFRPARSALAKAGRPVPPRSPGGAWGG